MHDQFLLQEKGIQCLYDTKDFLNGFLPQPRGWLPRLFIWVYVKNLIFPVRRSCTVCGPSKRTVPWITILFQQKCKISWWSKRCIQRNCSGEIHFLHQQCTIFPQNYPRSILSGETLILRMLKKLCKSFRITEVSPITITVRFRFAWGENWLMKLSLCDNPFRSPTISKFHYVR